MGDILVNDGAINQNREVRKKSLNGKMMSSALGHVELIGLEVIKVGLEFNICDRKDTFRRYLHTECKWNLGVEQIIESMLREERRKTRMSPRVNVNSLILVNQLSRDTKRLLYVWLSGEYGLLERSKQILRGESTSVMTSLFFKGAHIISNKEVQHTLQQHRCRRRAHVGICS